MAPDDTLPHEAGRTVDLLRYQEDAGDSSVHTVRTGKRAKISRVTPRPNIVRRVDQGAELRAVRVAVANMTEGEFACWIALKEGVLFAPLSVHARHAIARRLRANGRLRYVRGWHVVPPPATAATVLETAMHYGYRESTVRVYDRAARDVLAKARALAGLTGPPPAMPVWPLLMPGED